MFLTRLFFIAISIGGLHAATLSPSSPITISGTADVTGKVVVAGNATGFVAAWVRLGDVYASFSSDGGLTWGTPVLVSDASGTHTAGNSPSIAASSLGFAISWVKIPPGASGYAAYVNFSANGTTWSSDAQVNNSDGDTSVLIGANGDGFVVAFRTASGQRAYANFSSNGTTWNSMGSVQIDSGNQSWLATLPCAGSSAGFMVLFSRVTGGSADLATPFSIDGMSWMAVGTIPSTSVPFADITALTLANSSSDYLAGWIQSGVLKSSSTLNNGDVWSSPIDVPTGMDISSPTFSGSANGFISGWIEGGITAKVSLTQDLGVTWSSPVEVPGATFLSSAINSGSFNSTTLLSWVDGAGNPVVSRIGLATEGSIPIPTGKESFFQLTEPNRAPGGLFR